jgi:hypothetical protein
MKLLTVTLLTVSLFAGPRQVSAGTLDDAPFRVIVPNSEWQIDDSKTQSMGSGTVLVATLINTNTGLKGVVLKMVLKKSGGAALDDFWEGMREGVAEKALKKPSDEETTFLGHKARRFTFQTIHEDEVIYRELTASVIDRNVWAIACVGRLEDKDETRKILSFFQKKAPPKRSNRGAVDN